MLKESGQFFYLGIKGDVDTVHLCFVRVFVLQGGGAGEQAYRQPYSP